MEKPEKPEPPVHKTPGLFNKKKVIAENAKMDEEYALQLEKYNETKRLYDNAYAAYNIERKSVEQEIKRLKKEIKEKQDKEKDELTEKMNNEIAKVKKSIESDDYFFPEKEENRIIQEEIEWAKNEYIKLLCFRESFYTTDIIFEKYRTLPALSTIYEYLASGRVDALTGANGAYNLYESELRSNLIIDKLDVVIDKLEEIKQAQFKLCNIMKSVASDIKRIGNSLDDVCSSLEKIEGNTRKTAELTKKIEKNTALTTYYAEKTAFYSRIVAGVSVAAYLGI